MSDKKKSDETTEIDFTSSPSFQKSVKRTKWKQFLLYITISLVTMVILAYGTHVGSQYLINKKIEADDSAVVLQFSAWGTPGVSEGSEMFSYHPFNATSETTYYKEIDDRKIIWDVVTKKYPAIGRSEVIDRNQPQVEIIRSSPNPEEERAVRYNEFINERRIVFYYPGLQYNYLPNELEIATGLDDNTLIEVALSFEEPMTFEDLGEELGKDNVDWLWANSATEAEMYRIKDLWDNDIDKVQDGEKAFGYELTPFTSYAEGAGADTIRHLENLSEESGQYKNIVEKIKTNAEANDGQVTFNGAVVSGTPEELERFGEFDFIRASVIGVTIDKY